MYCEILVYFLKYIYSVKLAFSQDQLSSEEKGPGIFLPCLLWREEFCGDIYLPASSTHTQHKVVKALRDPDSWFSSAW